MFLCIALKVAVQRKSSFRGLATWLSDGEEPRAIWKLIFYCFSLGFIFIQGKRGILLSAILPIEKHNAIKDVEELFKYNSLKTILLFRNHYFLFDNLSFD